MKSTKHPNTPRRDPGLVYTRGDWRVTRAQYLEETGRLEQLKAERAEWREADLQLAARLRKRAKRAKGASA